jgi:hypothetical protein
VWNDDSGRVPAHTRVESEHGRCSGMRLLRVVVRVFTGTGWVLTPPVGPFDFGFVVPPQRVAEVDPLTVPLTAHELETFQRLLLADWPGR